MKILAIDTATEACSVALLNEGIQDVIFDICPQQHSQRILPMIDEILSKHGLTVNDLDALAYGRGPGSFTGVRIATGIVQGLALGADLPVIEVSTLAAMAQQNYMQNGHRVSKVLIDARMQEVYFGHYAIADEDGDEIVGELQSEAVLSPQEAIAKFAEISDDTELSGKAGTGWEAHTNELLALSDIKTISVLYPSAEFMLPIAKKAFERSETISVDDISPIYLRDKVTWKKLPGK
jgi:tRNA threonylcarbamoyladenosine biosynthesis protein TsaB